MASTLSIASKPDWAKSYGPSVARSRGPSLPCRQTREAPSRHSPPRGDTPRDGQTSLSAAGMARASASRTLASTPARPRLLGAGGHHRTCGSVPNLRRAPDELIRRRVQVGKSPFVGTLRRHRHRPDGPGPEGARTKPHVGPRRSSASLRHGRPRPSTDSFSPWDRESTACAEGSRAGVPPPSAARQPP